MNNAAQLRQNIEASLSRRIPGALSPRGRVEPQRLPSGIEAVDELLLSGLPVGAVCEFVGPECSGRTTVALSLLAQVTRDERVAAWIDVADALDPGTAAANGVDLTRLLWVRCGPGTNETRSAVAESAAKGMSSPSLVPVSGGGGRHPRSEASGMPEAITAMLLQHGGLHDKHVGRQNNAIGTPGAQNRPLLFRAEDRQEQVATDRLPARRGEYVMEPRRAEPMHVRRATSRLPASPAKRGWDALDQALKSADLLLQGGGFSMIVLDLGSTPAEMAWRIPLATWFRYRAACERTQVSLLLLTQHPCARSSAQVVVRMNPGEMLAENRVMTSIAYRAEKERQRFEGREDRVVSIRKQPQRERGAGWVGKSAWAL